MDYSLPIKDSLARRILRVERDVYYAQGFNSWGVLQVGMTLFRIWNGTRKPFAWRLELLTPLHKFRFSKG